MGLEQSVEASPVTESNPDTEDDKQQQEPSCALVVSGPAGAGKTTLINMLIKNESDFATSIRHTTRPSKTGELVI